MGGDAGDDSEATETDNERFEDDAGKLPWYARSRFPFEMSEEDKLVISTMASTCRMWYDASSSFTLPDDVFANTGHMKIHDWYCMSGCIGAYIVCQSENMTPLVKQRIISWLFAIEAVTAKDIDRTHLREHQGDIIKATADLIPILPLHVTATIVNEQIQHFEQQVRFYYI